MRRRAPPPRQTVPAPWAAAHPNGPSTRSASTRAATRPISRGSAPRLRHRLRPPPNPQTAASTRCAGASPAPPRQTVPAPLTPSLRQTVPPPWTAAPARCAGASPAPPLTPPPRQTVPAPLTAAYPNAATTRCAGTATRPISLASAPREPAPAAPPPPTKPADRGTGSQRWHFNGPALDTPPTTANRPRALGIGLPQRRCAGASPAPARRRFGRSEVSGEGE